MPLGASLTVKADPYAIVLPGSQPYALMNKGLPRIGGNYGGKDNLDGGITNQLLTSELSNFLHCFDAMILRAKVNYRYLPIIPEDNKRGQGLITQMINAIDEIISVAKSTSYYQLAINQYYIATDLPGGKGYDKTKIADMLSLGTPQGLYCMLICYQIYLQAIASAFNMYNKFRANQGLMIDMSWNRETPKLNSWFSLANKSSMVNQWKSLAYILNGEYFDAEWMRQYNMIGSLVSRRSQSMSDPVLEIACTHNVPKFKLLATDGTVLFDSATIDAIFSNSLNPDISKAGSFEGALDLLSNVLSINDTLYWVRNPAKYQAATEQSRFNYLVAMVTCLTNAASLFKPAMGDLRTMLDTLARTQVIQWKKNTQLEIYDNLYAQPSYNLTVNDFYKTLLSGADEVSWDNTTRRWSLTTPWDYYEGIPEYDSKSGGVFLSLSTKTFTTTDETGQSTNYLPVLISGFIKAEAGGRSGLAYIINRLGTNVVIDIATGKLSSNRGLARLNPMAGYDFKVRVPYTATSLDKLDQSFLNIAIMRVLGVFSYGSTNTIDADTDLSVNPDLLCFITTEVDDLQNEMITYCRTKGPFVVNPDLKSEMGFLGLS